MRRASGGNAAKSASQPPGRPRGGLAGTPRPPASTFVPARSPPTTSRAKASPATPASRGHRSPCSAEAAQGSPELLCSGRDGGGAWGDVALRAPAASEECGLRCAPPPLLPPPAGKTRASPAARPAPPLFATWARWPRGYPAARGKRGTWRSSLPDSQDSTLGEAGVWEYCGQTTEEAPRGEASWVSVPQGGGPTRAAGGRKKRERRCDL